MSFYKEHQGGERLILEKATNYCNTYDPSLLQSVPRNLNHDPLRPNIIDMPSFRGGEIWTLYELSWLNENGLPQLAVGNIELSYFSINLVESKSFKIYLNSFNQTRFANWETVRATLQRDLMICAQGTVTVTLHRLDELEGKAIAHFHGSCIDNQDIEINNYHYDANYLQDATCGKMVEETLVSHLLKSNCPISNQPDWGSVQIQYHGLKIDHEKLLRYLISFRHHNEFHEHCVDRIFYDILHHCRPERLSVYARYTRRGGLDINPWRTNTNFVPKIERLVRQ